MTGPAPAKQAFHVELIKPSHYDDDGYVIQWVRSLVPSNSLASVSALAVDAQMRGVLGDAVDIQVRQYDEIHTVIPTKTIIRRIQKSGGKGLVLLTGVQSNQFPRAVDIAGEFLKAGIPVAIGGFHVSGCISMLSELPPEIKAAQEMGIALFAGEAEQRMDDLFRDAFHGRMQPIYNYLDDLPALQGQITPFLPYEIAKRSFHFGTFDVGRGCPFRCSFCTIINVQGRKSRHRDADDVEKLVRAYNEAGIHSYFITDDNMARNKNWEAIFDRLIELREQEGLKIQLFMQVDTMCHKIPHFIEKATRAGCRRVFIGMESVSPENLKAAQKFQNRIGEYRTMLQEWRKYGTVTYAGYILGFPADTPESIERDILLIQRELPIDILEFFVMTPLPGSADHKQLYEQGVWMESDMNLYDTEHVTTSHPRMTKEEWQKIYDRAWHLYYSPQHIETLLRRAGAGRTGVTRTMWGVLLYYGSYRFEHMHPLQSGFVRRRVRRSRRPTLPRENPLIFYPRQVWQTARTWISFGLYALKLERLRRRILKDPARKLYSDLALEPVHPDELAPPTIAGAAAESCEPCETEPAVIPLSVLTDAPEPADAHRAA